MRATIDAELCAGCCVCTEACPEVFEMDRGLAKFTVESVPEEERADCFDAAWFCPAGAITLE